VFCLGAPPFAVIEVNAADGTGDADGVDVVEEADVAVAFACVGSDEAVVVLLAAMEAAVAEAPGATVVAVPAAVAPVVVVVDAGCCGCCTTCG